MHLRAAFSSAAEGAATRARAYLVRQLEQEDSNDDVVDLTEVRWGEPDNLTDDFDDKLAKFMAFDDPNSSRQWLLGER